MTMNKTELLNIFKNEDERILAAKITDMFFAAKKKNIPIFSDFFEYKKFALMKESLLSNFEMEYDFFGGFSDFERGVLCVFPEYCDKDFVRYPISCLSISYNKKFSSGPTHREYLGSLIGLGIERDKIGDILLSDFGAVVFLKEEISNFVIVNLERVGRTPVKVSESDINEIKIPEKNKKEIYVTVSSLRLDAILCKAFNISRSTAKDLVNAEKAFVNHLPIKDISFNRIKEGDIISLRGYGRIILTQIEGLTKKDKIKLLITKFV